jgi:hypothetical protein
MNFVELRFVSPLAAANEDHPCRRKTTLQLAPLLFPRRADARILRSSADGGGLLLGCISGRTIIILTVGYSIIAREQSLVEAFMSEPDADIRVNKAACSCGHYVLTSSLDGWKRRVLHAVWQAKCVNMLRALYAARRQDIYKTPFTLCNRVVQPAVQPGCIM